MNGLSKNANVNLTIISNKFADELNVLIKPTLNMESVNYIEIPLQKNEIVLKQTNTF